MPPQLDFLVAVLELVAFFLVTPEVIGRRRLEAAFGHMGRLTTWLREVWFSPDFGPIPPSNAALFLILLCLVIAGLFGFDLPHTQTLLAWIMVPLSVIPAAFVALYLLLRAMHRRERLGRILAVLGAALFVTGRIIVIASAYHRLPS